ncbi:MAG: ATP-dependent DNA helicase RecG [Propionibacteriaceae bacterium]|nr:ATP-dependent DNA helicase RecG [Propionibacteriaceae bacterium]
MAWSGQQWLTSTARALHTPLADVLGDKAAKALAQMGLVSVDDLMHHLPRRYLSGTETTDLGEVRAGQTVAVVARVGDRQVRGQQGEARWRLECTLTDGRNTIAATFFGQPKLVNYWNRVLGLGVKGIFVGKVGEFRHRPQLTHPDFVMLDEHGAVVARANEVHQAMARQVTRGGLVGIYPATAKLPTWQVGECADIVLDTLAGLPDSLPPGVVAAERLPGLIEAFEAIHRPVDAQRVDAALRRLKFEEALALQLTMAYRRAARGDLAAVSVTPKADGLRAAFDARLPFVLTKGQLAVGAEIAADMARTTPMQRLLQGEVGSGKTVVALRAMLDAVDAGCQAVLLAPTEVLAGQHAATITAMLGDLVDGGTLGAPTSATRLVTVTGAMSAISRRHAFDALASGEAGLVVGTHALLYERVHFANLGLVVIDEQHRFGVEQRAMLTDRTQQRPHVLVMTATPIPRSVAMTVFGDLEMSTLSEVPAGRGDVVTTVVELEAHPRWLARAWQRCCEEVDAGRQVFVVVPRINAKDVDETSDDTPRKPSASAVELVDQLASGALRGLRLGLLHGRLTAAEKDDVMGRFAAGLIDVLVCTTVIEVGVDVPNASMMVVMDADRFGVSQLHQLRGRIGRGHDAGVCLLVTNAEKDSKALQRLTAVAGTRDGFALADYDLIARREGDVLGAQQSGGRSTLRLLRALDDAALIAHARDVAERMVADDPECKDPRLVDLVAAVENNSDWLDRT